MADEAQRVDSDDESSDDEIPELLARETADEWFVPVLESLLRINHGSSCSLLVSLLDCLFACLLHSPSYLIANFSLYLDISW